MLAEQPDRDEPDAARTCRGCAKTGDGLVVIDEAYHEFAGESVVPLLERHANLVVLRTFSKAKALAGLRVGYLLAAPDLVREINKARLPYNVNFFSQAAAIAALGKPSCWRRTYAGSSSSATGCSLAWRTCPACGLWPSRANFFILELLAAEPKAVFASLLRRGVLVRDVTSYPMLSRCLRVSVGSEAENEAFLHALGTALGEAGMNLHGGEGLMAASDSEGRPAVRRPPRQAGQHRAQERARPTSLSASRSTARATRRSVPASGFSITC